MGDDTVNEFTKVKPSRWNKNTRNRSSSSNTPIPTYSPTTEWPTYSPTTVEDKAEWLRKKQKYLKNRDKVPDSVWEEDEASVGKKKQLWLEKQKDKKKNNNNKSSNVSDTKEEQNTEDQQQARNNTNPTQAPTYYDPPLVPTRKQNQLEKREKLAAQQQQNTTNIEESSNSFSPSSAPTVLDSSSESEPPSSSSVPTISSIPTVNAVQKVPTREKRKQDRTQALLDSPPSQLPSVSPTTDSRYNSSRYSGGSSRTPPKSRSPPVARPSEEDVTLEEAKEEEAKEESEPEALESSEKVEPIVLETKKEESDDKDEDKVSPSTTTQKVSFTIPSEELEKHVAVRDVPKPTREPTRSPVERTQTVKVNFTFINNRAKKRLTPSPTPAITSSEPTYLLFPTSEPTLAHPTYEPTSAWTWAPSVNTSRKRATDALFEKRTCPSDNLFFAQELRTVQEQGNSVFFTYGVQTSKEGNIEEAVEKIQLWLLDDVANKLLHCPNSGFVMRSNDYGRKDGAGVISSVYYSKDDRQYAQECNPTNSEADMCAIVSSTMRFEEVDDTKPARSKVLAVIFNQLQSGFDARLEEANILDLAYLGPELGFYQPDNVEVKGTPTSNSSIPSSAYAAIGVASFTVLALLLCLLMRCKLRKECRKAPSVVSSYRDVASYHDIASHHDGSYSFTQSDSRRSYYR